MPLNQAYGSFHGNPRKLIYPPGTVLYRVVDPQSFDNAVFWMTKAEFDKLGSKAEWRRRFAVWGSWNGNGEYVTYTVPPGHGLRGWEGVVASQADETGAGYVLQGGGRQIAVDPADLHIGFVGTRRTTNWGYSDFNDSRSLVGVPTLKNNWYSQ